MEAGLRRMFFTLFLVFFLVLLPFIIILSLGYSIDLKNREVTHNLTVKVETYPRSGEVTVGQKKFSLPVELRIPSGTSVNMKIERQGFFPEQFDLWSKQNENTSARIDNLWLLPQEPETEYQQPNTTFIGFLDDVRTLTKVTDGRYFVSIYGFAGPENKPSLVLNPDRVEIKFGKWQLLLENIYWQREQGLVLFVNSEGSWQVLNLKSFNQDFNSIITVDKNNLLLLDSQGNLWSLNLSTKVLRFEDKGYLGLGFTQTPDYIWLLDNRSVYRFERRGFIDNFSSLNRAAFITGDHILRLTQGLDVQSYESFSIENLFLGLAIKINKGVLYIPDSNKNSWQLIADNARKFATSGSTIFWLDYDNNLYSYNLVTKHQRILRLPELSSTDVENFSLNYHFKWRRLFLYTDKEVVSYWIDAEISNTPILSYNPVKWVENATCYNLIKENYQFCIQDGNLISYRNNALAFF